MLLPTSKTFTRADVSLAGGSQLAELTLAYETFGTLADDGNNAILLCHGYTSHPHAGGDADGWFANLMGSGKVVDTDNYFVVCSNMLGSAYGSSGPASIDPATGQPYGPDFPTYSTTDMIAAQHALIEHLGVGQLAAVMGYSYGGHLTYLWGCTYPDRMRALVPIAGVIERKTTVADIDTLRSRFATCPGWNGGRYYGREKESGVHDMMVNIRAETLSNYGIGKHLGDTLGDSAARDARIAEQAETWAEAFDANALIKLSEAGIGSSAVPKAGAIKAPLMHVLSRSDSVVPVSLGPATVEMLRAKGVDASFVEIPSDYGHAGPMIDADLWSGSLRDFLDKSA
ncbi:MAG: alpha/beta fold hydrolase [Rhodospirillaceae bacterium]|nr:alpha/beta fold hydrolase [Rhodospirillaceae bacterium]